jgi:hypothetical protein
MVCKTLPAWINAAPLEEMRIVRRHPQVRSTQDESCRRLVAELALSLTQAWSACIAASRGPQLDAFLRGEPGAVS